jgi:hypothetical protein
MEAEIYTFKLELEKEEPTIDSVMEGMPTDWRNRWCTAPENGGCGCMGCANYSGGLNRKGFTRADWEKWREENERTG